LTCRGGQKLQESNLELERLAVTDKLSQLPNRVKIDEMLERELARTERSGQEFSIVPGNSVSAMIKRTDQALYRAKNAGR
jgi:PleD family two-component response regulator